ncbi:MAG: carboxyl transferase domain-containing protein, partial [FCB group bacterium]
MDTNKEILDKKIKKMYELQEKALQAGGKKRIDDQHAKGKLTARERIDLLLDKGSFRELDALVHHHSDQFGLAKQVFLGDGVVTGYGTIDEQKVFIFSQDFTVLGGSLAEEHGKKIVKIMQMALKN